jgi:hypothetical protein
LTQTNGTSEGWRDKVVESMGLENQFDRKALLAKLQENIFKDQTSEQLFPLEGF